MNEEELIPVRRYALAYYLQCVGTAVVKIDTLPLQERKSESRRVTSPC